MAIDVLYMSTEELAQSLETARLEQRYEEALRQAERIYEEERARVLRVQLLLMEDENDSLRDQMLEDEDEMQKLEQTKNELHEKLSATEADFQNAQIDLKAQTRDANRYKAEVDALNATSSDSTKVLAEKLALTRELAALKPELDHLKTQAATQQNLLGEKLALERELSAIQVELETEKRAVQRIKTQDKTTGHTESVMLNDIEDLKKEITKEKRNVQKAEREHMKKAAAWDNEKEVLEGKLEAFRNKLRTTKEQLKESQEELENIQQAKFARAAEAAKARMSGVNPKKRNVARFDPDMTIGTPGNGGPAKKQRTSVLPGDKSTFSITPFLNKTLSILPESPAETQSNVETKEPERVKNVFASDQSGAEEEENRPAVKSVAKKAAPKKAPATKAKTTEPLKESTNPKANKIVKKPTLAQVLEEESEAESAEPENVKTAVSLASTAAAATDMKKKKLLANRPTIFDEDEDAAPKRVVKKMSLTGLRNGMGAGSGFGKINLPGKNKMLADFSPLKKDRRIMA